MEFVPAEFIKVTIEINLNRIFSKFRDKFIDKLFTGNSKTKFKNSKKTNKLEIFICMLENDKRGLGEKIWKDVKDNGKITYNNNLTIKNFYKLLEIKEESYNKFKILHNGRKITNDQMFRNIIERSIDEKTKPKTIELTVSSLPPSKQLLIQLKNTLIKAKEKTKKIGDKAKTMSMRILKNQNQNDTRNNEHEIRLEIPIYYKIKNEQKYDEKNSFKIVFKINLEQKPNNKNIAEKIIKELKKRGIKEDDYDEMSLTIKENEQNIDPNEKLPNLYKLMCGYGDDIMGKISMSYKYYIQIKNGLKDVESPLKIFLFKKIKNI